MMIFTLTALFVLIGAGAMLGGLLLGNARAEKQAKQELDATRKWWFTHFEAMRRAALDISFRELGFEQSNQVVDRAFKEQLADMHGEPSRMGGQHGWFPTPIAEENSRRLRLAQQLWGSDRARDG